MYTINKRTLKEILKENISTTFIYSEIGINHRNPVLYTRYNKVIRKKDNTVLWRFFLSF